MTQKSPDVAEGWESLAEEAERGSLASNPELEAALREAAAAFEDTAPDAGVSELDLIGPRPKSESASQEEIEDLSAELIELKDRLLRMQAEFDNFRKRALKERQETLLYGHQNLAKDLLSVVDNLDRALDHSRTSEGGDLKSLLRGVELVQKELLGALGNHSVTRVEALGRPFDPAVHEAMAQAPDGTVSENTVIEVFEEGYLLKDRLLRPARVVVAKAPSAADNEGNEAGD